MKANKDFQRNKLRASFDKQIQAKLLQKYEEVLIADESDKKKDAEKARKRQLSLKESADHVRLLNINDHRAQRIPQKISEMKATHWQPISIVDDGRLFHLLKALEPHYYLPSRRYTTETVVTETHEGVKSEVRNQLWQHFLVLFRNRHFEYREKL